MKIKEVMEEFNLKKITKSEYITKMHKFHKILFEYSHLLKDTQIENINICDDSVVLKTRDTKAFFIADQYDERCMPIEAFNFGNYEHEEMEMILKLLKKDNVIIDIGGNIGWYAVNLGLKRPDSIIYTFEPIPKTYEYLQKNIQLNNLKNVTPNNFGFSEKDDTLTFYYYPEGSGNASMANLTKKESVLKIKCKVTTLDSFIEKNKIKVDFIKCDVEGAELFVFNGAKKVLQNQKPIVFTEMLRKWAAEYKYHPNQIIDLFLSFGYSCFTIRDKNLKKFGKMDENTIETNYIFLHNEKHETYIKNFVC